MRQMKAPLRVHLLHAGTSRAPVEGLCSSAKARELSEHAASAATFPEVLSNGCIFRSIEPGSALRNSPLLSTTAPRFGQRSNDSAKLGQKVFKIHLM